MPSLAARSPCPPPLPPPLSAAPLPPLGCIAGVAATPSSCAPGGVSAVRQRRPRGVDSRPQGVDSRPQG
eukprot:100014-Prorocentrum_minimum.AAC.1